MTRFDSVTVCKIRVYTIPLITLLTHGGGGPGTMIRVGVGLELVGLGLRLVGLGLGQWV